MTFCVHFSDVQNLTFHTFQKKGGLGGQGLKLSKVEIYLFLIKTINYQLLVADDWLLNFNASLKPCLKVIIGYTQQLVLKR